MSDYLMRDDAPISKGTWASIDALVVEVVKKNLDGRRFIPMVGPLGWGVEQAPITGSASEDGVYVATDTKYLALQEIASKFMLKAKHLSIAEQTPFSLDLGAVAWAATSLAQAEDEMILKGLLKAAKKADLGAWDEIGGPFKAIASATAEMRADGCDGPYALVMNPGMFARLASLMQYGRREIAMVERLVSAGVFQSVKMPESQVLVVSPQAWNVDLVVGQDVVTAWLGNEGLDQLFRIFETLVLRIKRPKAIRVLS